MPAVMFGAVYSIATGQIRRYYYPTDDSQIATYPLLPGEAIVSISRGPYPNAAAWQTAVTTAVTNAAGKAPGNPRCAMIDANGNVVGVIMADPSIDSVSGMTLVNTTVADVGWTWTIGGGFVGPTPVIGVKP
jgi:hypothetical protein